ncbi:hypothetical protein CesoFtcFv8_008593 [Champsocephalus esox]|uniref:Secreted protein n=1 Tax=Champsocephalus esox TaxID=159716 RepID=A0AAN8H1S2_9TELE|nr:hypothetical protein CesoFtcFv8_008593 [Champsocephalus esox]
MNLLAFTSLSVCPCLCVVAGVIVTCCYIAEHYIHGAQCCMEMMPVEPGVFLCAHLWPWRSGGPVCARGRTDANTCGAAGRVPVGRKWAISTVLAPAFYSTSVHITEGRPLTN